MDIAPYDRRRVGQLAVGRAVGGAAWAAVQNKLMQHAVNNAVRNMQRGDAPIGPPPAPKRRNKAAKKGGDKGSHESPAYGGRQGVGRTISLKTNTLSRLRMSDKFLLGITNSSTNQSLQYYGMQFNQQAGWTNGYPLLNSFVRIAAMGGNYVHYRLIQVKFTWVPNVAETTSGNFMMRWQSDPSATTNESDPNKYINSDVSIFTHVQRPGTLYWRPRERKELEEKFIRDSTTATQRTMDELSAGVVQLHSNNNLAIGASLGHLYIEVDVEFSNSQS